MFGNYAATWADCVLDCGKVTALLAAPRAAAPRSPAVVLTRPAPIACAAAASTSFDHMLWKTRENASFLEIMILVQRAAATALASAAAADGVASLRFVSGACLLSAVARMSVLAAAARLSQL